MDCVRQGEGVKISPYTNLYRCVLKNDVFVGPFVEIQTGVVVGERSRISSHSFLCEGVTLGKDVFVGHGVMFTNDRFTQKGRPEVYEETFVGDGVRIGSNATILPGITIGECAVIGGGCVVTKDVPPFATFVGNPGRIVRVKDKEMEGYPFLKMTDVTASQREELNSAISRVLDHSRFLFGEEITQFEKEFAAWIGADYCVGCANGTAALEAALYGMGIGKGDKIVVQTNTFAASALAIRHVGAIPVFVDCDSEGRLDLEQAETACREGGVKALMVVHLYGECPDMDRVTEIVRKTGVDLIEDCAQAHGTAWKGQKVGTFGRVGCFSFYPGKNLGAMGDAGALVTNEEDLAERARTYGNIGSKEKYVHVCQGINSRMDTLQAAILSVKLPHLNGWNAQRRKVAEWYETYLGGCEFIRVLQGPLRGHPSMTHTYHLLVVLLSPEVDRSAFMAHLNDHKVGCLVHYPHPCHTMEAFKEFNSESHPMSEDLSRRMVSLPIHPFLTEEDVKAICEVCRTFFSS